MDFIVLPQALVDSIAHLLRVWDIVLQALVNYIVHPAQVLQQAQVVRDYIAQVLQALLLVQAAHLPQVVQVDNIVHLNPAPQVVQVSYIV